MEPKNPNKTPKKIGKRFTNILTQARPKNAPTKSYDTIAVVHNKFSNLVSSKTVYSLHYCPKTGHK